MDTVWEKGTILHDSLKDIVRIDRYGTHISRLSFGKQEKYGWEIDHITPVSEGGTDDIENLQPLQWENNRRKGNNHH
jgi:5-methylcytosine-specific restriction endonuclease McrA